MSEQFKAAQTRWQAASTTVAAHLVGYDHHPQGVLSYFLRYDQT